MVGSSSTNPSSHNQSTANVSSTTSHSSSSGRASFIFGKKSKKFEPNKRASPLERFALPRLDEDFDDPDNLSNANNFFLDAGDSSVTSRGGGGEKATAQHPEVRVYEEKNAPAFRKNHGPPGASPSRADGVKNRKFADAAEGSRGSPEALRGGTRRATTSDISYAAPETNKDNSKNYAMAEGAASSFSSQGQSSFTTKGAHQNQLVSALISPNPSPSTASSAGKMSLLSSSDPVVPVAQSQQEPAVAYSTASAGYEQYRTKSSSSGSRSRSGSKETTVTTSISCAKASCSY